MGRLISAREFRVRVYAAAMLRVAARALAEGGLGAASVIVFSQYAFEEADAVAQMAACGMVVVHFASAWLYAHPVICSKVEEAIEQSRRASGKDRPNS